jgi:arylsulfatase A-like enzyme
MMKRCRGQFFRSGVGAVVLGFTIIGYGEDARVAKSSRPNVLFIAVDDLNHWVGHLGRNVQASTPNIDRLASRGVTFTRAYCAAPACNPSRAALMSGLRPSTTGVYHNPTDWRRVIGTELMLTTQFRNAGFLVAGAGKIYHGRFDRDEEWEEYVHPSNRGRLKKHASAKDDGVSGIKFAPLDCDDADLADYGIASWGVKKLSERHSRPFFLAVGFHKPHMPWNVPRKWYDLHPLDSIQLPSCREDDLEDIPVAGVKMAKPRGDHAAMQRSGRWKEAVQAYLATCSYVDAQVGRVMEALDRSAYRDNTMVVLWGDHGWHLGEKQHWRKFALWEEAARAPLIWVVPGITPSGGRCDRTVDFMSIYPTLCDLAGLPIPNHVEGPSLRPLLRDPSASWDRPALTTHGFQNHALRSERWRLIRYADGSLELYDHDQDPYEWMNRAGETSTERVRRDLAGWFPRVNEPEVAGGVPTRATRLHSPRPRAEVLPLRKRVF